MTLFSINWFAFLASLITLSAIPGPSDIAVVSRSLTHGKRQAFLVILGIIAGDLLLLTIAAYGLHLFFWWLESLFIILQYVSAALLIAFAIRLWYSRSSKGPRTDDAEKYSSFLLGLATTLGDPKALLFFFAFLPTFIEASDSRTTQLLSIALAGTIAVLLVKGIYAATAFTAISLFHDAHKQQFIKRLAAIILAGAAILLVSKSI